MGRSIIKVIDIIQDRSYLDEQTGCFVYTGCINDNGYGIIGFAAKQWLVHRLVYRYVKNCELNCQVRHSCDNPPCWNPEHLLGGTHVDNLNDKMSRGRQSRGVTQHRAKLTEDQVREIRELAHLKYEEVGRMYNIDPSAIRKIILGITWKHVE